jgi:hypothetical protein
MKTQPKRIFSYFLIILLLTLMGACSASRQYALQTEKEYQEAFNRVYFQGRAEMEVHVKYGRIDLLTGDYAIEVDKIDNFHEGIGQALHYARETGMKPGSPFLSLNPQNMTLRN